MDVKSSRAVGSLLSSFLAGACAAPAVESVDCAPTTCVAGSSCARSPLCPPEPEDTDAEELRPAAQAAVWLELGPALNACTLTEPVEVPLGARQTVESSSAEGERVVDGGEQGYEVRCRVQALAPEVFDVELHLRAADVSVEAAGVLSFGGSNVLAVSFMDAQQADCEASVQTVLPGAVWLQDVRCGALHQSAHPGFVCAGTMGMIFENCDVSP